MLQRFVLFLTCFNAVELYRTSMCLRNHEQFSLCGWRCPPTCVNLKLLASKNPVCPSVWDCRVGCRCAAGYVRDEYSKNCIQVQKCPGLTAPVKNDIEKINNSAQAKEDSIPVAVMLVIPDKPAISGNDELTGLSSGSAVSEDHSSEHFRSYEEPIYPSASIPYKPSESSSSPAEKSGAVAIFSTSVSPSAIPILLNCAPKVIMGQLSETKAPAYRSTSDIADLLQPGQDLDFNVSDVLGLDSPPSEISLEGNEHKRRSASVEPGATHHKVSEDYPEPHQGNRHLVSKDYPQPNMIRVSDIEGE